MRSNPLPSAGRKSASLTHQVDEARNDIQDVLYRVAERAGLPTKAADHAVRRYVDDMIDDMLEQAAKRKRNAH